MPGLDEFQVVTRRRRPGRRFFGNRLLGQFRHRIEPDINIEQVLRQVLDAVIAIRNSPYRQILYNGLAESLSMLDVDVIPEIVCYGLGNFSENRSAKYQLAALLTMKSRYRSRVHIYDPIFFPKEIEVLKTLGLIIIETNEEAKRKAGDNITLFYMPHCYKGLVANCIYANWGEKINNCILMTNSFTEMSDDIIGDDADLRDAVELIRRINPYTSEIALEEKFDAAREAFHCTSIHIFPNELINNVPDGFWTPLAAAPYHYQGIEHGREHNRD
ncbi:hypothetical protein PV326_007105 [Microctonus aethiopoides]|nr:hypothetical protein PV326_007105 [Microctonus aethiopoides]